MTTRTGVDRYIDPGLDGQIKGIQKKYLESIGKPLTYRKASRLLAMWLDMYISGKPPVLKVSSRVKGRRGFKSLDKVD